jgi:hypothetical protein
LTSLTSRSVTPHEHLVQRATNTVSRGSSDSLKTSMRDPHFGHGLVFILHPHLLAPFAHGIARTLHNSPNVIGVFQQVLRELWNIHDKLFAVLARDGPSPSSQRSG